MWDVRSVGNVSINVYAKFCCTPLHIKKALGIFGPLEKWLQEEEQLK